MIDDQAEVVARVVRGGVVESAHHGHLVALDSAGGVLLSRGNPAITFFPRSSLKLVQAVAMLRAGLDLDGELLALACASHSGEPGHLEGTRRILAPAGLTEGDLQNTPTLPWGVDAAHNWLLAGGGPASTAQACSGKHAAMLATCVHNGWDTATYLEPDHPLQSAIADCLPTLTGAPVEAVAVDGCGAPLLSTSLVGLARAFRRVATAVDGPERTVADAIRSFPEFSSGSRRDEAALMHAVPGAVGKAGAESCYAFGLADGRAVALKCDDGAPRARPVVMAAALERLGVTSESWVDAAAVRRTGVAELFGGGRPVGMVRATPWW